MTLENWPKALVASDAQCAREGAIAPPGAAERGPPALPAGTAGPGHV